MSRTPLAVGNWKMNGTSESARQLLSDIARDAPDTSRAALVVCVPFPYLEATLRRLLGTRIEWGAQSISEFEGGAHTGQWTKHMRLRSALSTAEVSSHQAPPSSSPNPASTAAFLGAHPLLQKTSWRSPLPSPQ